MRIVIDLQGAQSASGQRGIGRYSLNFAQALARNNTGHEIIIALNALFPETIRPIRAVFEGVLPAENIVVWDAPGPVAAIDPANAGRQAVTERIREAFIASLAPDIVHLSSLFEGFVDDAVTSIGRHGAACRVSATLYDLIPLLNQDQIMKDNPAYAAHYFRKLEDLKRASLLLAISGSAAGEAMDHLGWDPAKIVAVGTGADGRFRRSDIGAEARLALLGRLGLRRPFFMYVSAPDAHKNHRRLIEAYAGLPATVRQAHQLAFIGHFQPREREAFERHAAGCGLAADELVMIDGVADDDLNTLYNLAKGFVMPSWHEGFGLPAVEAMLCGRAAIGSRRASLPEVIGRDDALFDPFDVADMRLVLHRLATDDPWRAELEAHAITHARQFTWDRVAAKALEAFARTADATASPPPAPARDGAKDGAKAGYRDGNGRKRLAFFSPMPPQPSGISDYSMELLPALAAHYDIDIVVEQTSIDKDGLPASIGVRSAAWFREHAHDYDRILYQFGNSPFHDYMFETLPAHPGMIVLHDFFMCGLFGHRLQFSREAVARELVGEHGYAAAMDVRDAADVRRALGNYPANLQLLQGAIGVIVHSEHARQLAASWFGATGARDFVAIPLLRAPTQDRDREAARASLGIGP
ncbi:MAG TPA: glycosyltransferase, partial [Acidiphilium sp.]|nr:glycosyltransferase [Acidiphilium sp.]